MRGFFTSRLALVNQIESLRMRNAEMLDDLYKMAKEKIILRRKNTEMHFEINRMLEQNSRLKQQLNSQRCIKRLRDARGRFTK